MVETRKLSTHSGSEQDRELEELLLRASIYLKSRQTEPILKLSERQQAQVA
jgi:hypothetical protein